MLIGTTKTTIRTTLDEMACIQECAQRGVELILSRMNQRQRPTTVKVPGITIPQSRLERQKLRHRESTLDHSKSSR
jgi:hypothetical protein